MNVTGVKGHKTETSGTLLVGGANNLWAGKWFMGGANNLWAGSMSYSIPSGPGGELWLARSFKLIEKLQLMVNLVKTGYNSARNWRVSWSKQALELKQQPDGRGCSSFSILKIWQKMKRWSHSKLPHLSREMAQRRCRMTQQVKRVSLQR